MQRPVLLLSIMFFTTCVAANDMQAKGAAWRAQADSLNSEFLQATAQDRALDPIRNKMSVSGLKGQTFSMLVDTTRPTPEEQAAIRRFAEILAQYGARNAENDVRNGNPARDVLERQRAAFASLLAELHNGQFTYGEFAKRRQALADNVSQERRQVLQGADASRNAQEARNAEAARLNQEAEDRRNLQLLETGRALLQRPGQQAGASGSGFFTRSYVSGVNRICLYNRLGSEVAVTMNVGAMCPLQIP